MSRNAYWTNADGLVVGFGTRKITKNAAAKVAKGGAVEQLVVEVDFARLEDTLSVTSDAVVQGAVIPDGSLLQSAILTVDEAAAGATAEIDVGIYDVAGAVVTAVDDVLTAAVGALTAGADITGAGSKIGTVLAQDSKIGLTWDVAAFTAGTGTLVIEYIPKRV